MANEWIERKINLSRKAPICKDRKHVQSFAASFSILKKKIKIVQINILTANNMLHFLVLF